MKGSVMAKNVCTESLEDRIVTYRGDKGEEFVFG